MAMVLVYDSDGSGESLGRPNGSLKGRKVLIPTISVPFHASVMINLPTAVEPRLDPRLFGSFWVRLSRTAHIQSFLSRSPNAGFWCRLRGGGCRSSFRMGWGTGGGV